MSSPEQIPNVTVVDQTNHVNENGLSPSQSFIKTWRMKNIGTETWPNNLKLKFFKGDNFGFVEYVCIPAIAPNEITDVSIPMTAPSENGSYEGQWRIVTITGTFVGIFLVSIHVDSSNIISLTQQMSTLGQPEHIHNAEHSQPISTPLRPPVTATPFCSPTGYGMFGTSSIPSSTLNGEHLPTIDESTLNQQFQRTNLMEDHNGEFRSS